MYSHDTGTNMILEESVTERLNDLCKVSVRVRVCTQQSDSRVHPFPHYGCKVLNTVPGTEQALSNWNSHQCMLIWRWGWDVEKPCTKEKLNPDPPQATPSPWATTQSSFSKGQRAHWAPCSRRCPHLICRNLMPGQPHWGVAAQGILRLLWKRLHSQLF